ncbi:hypothetical protein QE152_g6617 [Popillia japonica]|uniref:Uncharacterized protein n=1 Tax=Popillia japonica TaxID=7064 RepID=A0AAW1MEN4_POPJA
MRWGSYEQSKFVATRPIANNGQRKVPLFPSTPVPMLAVYFREKLEMCQQLQKHNVMKIWIPKKEIGNVPAVAKTQRNENLDSEEEDEDSESRLEIPTVQ